MTNVMQLQTNEHLTLFCHFHSTISIIYFFFLFLAFLLFAGSFSLFLLDNFHARMKDMHVCEADG